MTEVTKTSKFQQAIEVVESLPLQDQLILLSILQKRLQHQQRKQLLREVEEVRQDYTTGNIQFGSVKDFLAELDA